MSGPGTFGELGLSIVGLGVEYPPFSTKPSDLEKLAKKHCPDTPAMAKVLAINRLTGIKSRSSIIDISHPIVNQPSPPSIAQLHGIFMSDGVPLAVKAARKAIDEARVDVSQITHIVSTTCTDSANPGFDHFVTKNLGITHKVEKVLLHGAGCSGGLAALRTAANLALGYTARGKPARILCLALEITSTLARSELESIDASQETLIGACLFSDCASAVVLSNGIHDPVHPSPADPPVYELLGWDHRIIPNTEEDLGFDVDPAGWKAILSPRVPQLAVAALKPTFGDLLSSLPSLTKQFQKASDFDWAMHPGGLKILTGAERELVIGSEHMRASYEIYTNHGNSSSATIFSVLDRLRQRDMDALAPNGQARDYVVGCAFGPGVSVEMCMMKRRHSVIQRIEKKPVTPRGAESEREVEDIINLDDGVLESSRSQVVEEGLSGAQKGPLLLCE